MFKILPFLLALLLAPLAWTETNAALSGGSSGTVVRATIQGISALVTAETEEEQVKRLVKSIDAIKASSVGLSVARKARIAKAALAASKATGVDATLLIAVARVESDFRGLQVISWKCRDPRFQTCDADCGITQHHIGGKRRWVIQRCKSLARNYEESFLKSAKELAHHVEFCSSRPKYNIPLKRCVLNRYNSGTFYLTAERCNRRYNECQKWCPRAVDGYTYTERLKCFRRCNKAATKCRSRSAYWKKVLCFDYGARRHLKPQRSCRYVWRLESIPTYFYRPTGTDPRTAEK